MESLQIDEKYISALKTFNINVEDALSEFIILNLSKKISEFRPRNLIIKKPDFLDTIFLAKGIRRFQLPTIFLEVFALLGLLADDTVAPEPDDVWVVAMVPIGQ